MLVLSVLVYFLNIDIFIRSLCCWVFIQLLNFLFRSDKIIELTRLAIGRFCVTKITYIFQVPYSKVFGLIVG